MLQDKAQPTKSHFSEMTEGNRRKFRHSKLSEKPRPIDEFQKYDLTQS